MDIDPANTIIAGAAASTRGALSTKSVNQTGSVMGGSIDTAEEVALVQ